MSQRIRAQLKSLKVNLTSQRGNGGEVTTHYYDKERVQDLFPRHGKRTDEKVMRLVARAGK